MFKATSLILALSILTGQLIKIPVSGLSGITILDLGVFLLSVIGTIKIRLGFRKVSYFLIPALLFIATGFFALLINPLHLSLEQTLISALYGLRFLLYLYLGYLVSIKALPSIENNLSDTLMVTGIGFAILGLIQLILIPNLSFLTVNGWDPHYFRTVSTLLDPNFLGVYLTLTLLLITLTGFKDRKPSNTHPLILRIGFILVYVALLTTFSRSAAVMFGVSFLTLSIIEKSKKIFLLTILLGIGFGITFLIYRATISQPRNIDRTQSAEFRLSDWQQGVKIFQSSPILGVGFNSYKYALQKYNLGSENFIQTRGATSNDSSLLFIAATSGVIGLIFYLSFLGILLKQSLLQTSRGNHWGALLCSGLCGLLINSFFIDSLFYPFILCWIFLVSSQTFSPKSS